MHKSLVQMVKCRWREFRREPSAFFWVLFMPIFWMLIFGFAFNGDTEQSFRVGWVGPANKLHNYLLEEGQKGGQLKVINIDDRSALNYDIASLAMHIRYQDEQNIIFYSDKNNSQSTTAKLIASQKIQEFYGQRPQVVIQEKQISGFKTRYIDFFIPGILALSIMTTSLFGTGMTLVAARRENLLKRYRASPMSPYLFFVSYVIGRLMILAAEVAVVLGAGWLIFGFSAFPYFVSFLVLSIFGAAAFTSLAIVLGSRFRNVAAMSGVTNLLVLPMMMLGGVFFAVENFPSYLQGVVRFLPLNVLVDGLRKVSLNEYSLAGCGFELTYLLVFTVVSTILAQRLFKWS